MATIEERAKEFAHSEGCMQCVRQRCYLTDCDKELRLKKQYIDIATEQRKIDYYGVRELFCKAKCPVVMKAIGKCVHDKPCEEFDRFEKFITKAMEEA